VKQALRGFGDKKRRAIGMELPELLDEDIPSIDTIVVPTATRIQGPITRARAKQLNNNQVLLLLGTITHIHENMMLPKSDVFITLRNDGPRMDKRDKHWSLIIYTWIWQQICED
jgi:hypothetical protein